MAVTVCCPALAYVEASGEKQVIHRKVGDSVELSSNLPTEGVSRPSWKYGNFSVADENGVLPNNRFQDRVEFNNVNFSLTVRELTLQDSGNFSFTSATEVQQRPTVIITLQVHEPISKQPDLFSNISEPDLNGFCTVYLDCRAASQSNITYIWNVGNQNYTGPKLQHTIGPQDGDTTFFCTASNVVSEMSAFKSVRCRNNTDILSKEDNNLHLVWILSAAGGGLLILVIIIVMTLCLCKRRWSGSDSNELTVYADISDFSPEVDPSDKSKPCSLYDTIENRTGPGQQKPQTIYDEIQFERMRKASVSPYQDVS
ncbi:hypothetical protein ATANTOWER_000859 [Ataeniobius toweri]|uniref:Ig-like domain-containing protein n=1 Tax=Ataeniobius toweri TaxID=208326 RepID=A0ABU7BFE9_9TELE|nr:hypothetical protein [Ataeniobius toweri]